MASTRGVKQYVPAVLPGANTPHCTCNDRDIQTEKHVLLECGLTQNIRNRYPMLNFMNTNSLFESGDHILSMCKYVHEVLDVYK